MSTLLSPSERYRSDLEKPAFQADPAQARVVAEFQALYEALIEGSYRASFWQRLLGRPAHPRRGVYLWGGPGRGKTYLMDCFYDSLPFSAKRRVHFHRFMLEIHALLDGLPRTPDPLRIIARELAARYRVLCLDEFHVTDIADAMLLGGLLEALFARGLVLVVTSNLAPDALYPDGIQRERFLPAIALLGQYCHVVKLEGHQDFRLDLLQKGGTYRVLDEHSGEHWLREIFFGLVAADPCFDVKLTVCGRCLQARAAADDVVWFGFDTLCLMPRSARDYLEMAREFHTVLLQGVPRMDENMDEAARRFIHLIDALYDHGVKLVMSAAVGPEELYAGEQLERAFRRTASRLVEMSSTAYLARPHRPD